MTNEQTATNAIQREYLPNGHYRELVSYKDFQKKKRRSALLKILAPDGDTVDFLSRIRQILLVHLLIAVVALLTVDALFGIVVTLAFKIEVIGTLIKVVLVLYNCAFIMAITHPLLFFVFNMQGAVGGLHYGIHLGGGWFMYY